MRILSIAGFQPQLFHCVSCRDEIEEQDQFFSAELGGVLSPECRQADRNARSISASAVKVLRYLQTRSWETVRVLQLQSSLHRELEGIMHYYLGFVLEKNLKSVEFLQRLRSEAAFKP